MEYLLWNLCYAIFAMQSLLCNLCYAIFAMQSLLCSKTLWNLCFLQYFAENIEKPLVFLCFCIHTAQKPYKTCGFCNILLKILKNQMFSIVFAFKMLKNLLKPLVFAIFCRKYRKTIGFPLFLDLKLQKTQKNQLFFAFFHRNTYRNTSGNGRESGTPAQLVRTQVRTPKCKHCLGNIYIE